MGNGANIAFLTDVCRATTLEERTPVLLFFNIVQQIGLLLGPACNLFLRELDFYIGPFHINKLNAPGFFLTVLYIIFEIVASLMYYDLKVAKDKQSDSDTSPIIDNDVLNEESAIEAVENITIQSEQPVPWSRYVNELLRGTYVCL